MDESSMSTRHAGVAGLFVVLLLIAGFGLAFQALAIPDVDRSEEIDIEVGISDNVAPEVEISVIWMIATNGDVTLDVEARPPGPEYGESVFFIQLYCDARIVRPPGAGWPSGVTVNPAGEEEMCEEGAALEPAGRARQKLTIVNYALIRGTPIRPWTQSIGGDRAVRTPHIDSSSSLPPGFYAYNAFESTLATAMSASPSETVSGVVPRHLPGDPPDSEWVASVWGPDRFELPARVWTADRHSQGLESVVVRWAQLGSAELDQWLVLISGALLGVAASVAVETLIWWTRASAPSPAMVSPPKEASHRRRAPKYRFRKRLRLRKREI